VKRIYNTFTNPPLTVREVVQYDPLGSEFGHGELRVPPTPSCASCSSCLEERAGSTAGALSQAGACQHGTQQHLLPAVARATAACFCDMCG
jgi:hypothetical protein